MTFTKKVRNIVHYKLMLVVINHTIGMRQKRTHNQTANKAQIIGMRLSYWKSRHINFATIAVDRGGTIYIGQWSLHVDQHLSVQPCLKFLICQQKTTIKSRCAHLLHHLYLNKNWFTFPLAKGENVCGNPPHGKTVKIMQCLQIGYAKLRKDYNFLLKIRLVFEEIRP